MDTAKRPQLLQSGNRMLILNQYDFPTLFGYVAGTDPRASGCTSTGPAGRTKFVGGVLRTVAANEPRYDHEIGGVPTWLLEGQRTNRLLNSADASSASWVKRGACRAVKSDYPDPTGGANAVRLTGVGGAGALGDNIYQNGSNYTSDASLGVASWIKRISIAGTLVLENSSSPTRGKWLIDMSLLPDTWARVTARHPAVTVVLPFRSNGTIAGAYFYSFAGGLLSFDLWNCNVEDNCTFESSDIITVASPVTRAAETAPAWKSWPSQTTTRYWRYYDLATAAWVENVDVAVRTGMDDFGAAAQLHRAYAAIKYLKGSLTLAQAQAI